MSDGPYCPSCGTYLGRGYTQGDECLECWEERNEGEPPSNNAMDDAVRERQDITGAFNPASREGA